MKIRDSAICVRVYDFSETSQVVGFFTRSHGMVRLLAKGSKRAKSKTGGAIDLTNEGDLVYIESRGAGLGTLTEFSHEVVHSGLRKDSARLNSALYMLELCGEFFDVSEPHVDVFDLLHNALARLDDADSPVSAVGAFFQWRMLRHAGLLGEMKNCVSCGGAIDWSARWSAAGKFESIYFSSILGGFVCNGCEASRTEKYFLTGPALAGLAALAAAERGEKVNISATQAQAAGKLLGYHAAHLLGKRLKMARYAMAGGKK